MRRATSLNYVQCLCSTCDGNDALIEQDEQIVNTKIIQHRLVIQPRCLCSGLFIFEYISSSDSQYIDEQCYHARNP